MTEPVEKIIIQSTTECRQIILIIYVQINMCTYIFKDVTSLKVMVLPSKTMKRLVSITENQPSSSWLENTIISPQKWAIAIHDDFQILKRTRILKTLCSLYRELGGTDLELNLVGFYLSTIWHIIGRCYTISQVRKTKQLFHTAK